MEEKMFSLRQTYLLAILSGCLLVEVTIAEVNGEFLHRIVLDNDGRVQLWWTPRSRSVAFRLRVDVGTDAVTPDYVALGTSPNGGMLGADIWMTIFDNNNSSRLVDMHAVGNQPPLMDRLQGLQLKHTRRHNGVLETTFEKHQSCDPDDINLDQNANINLIWAYGQLSGKGASPSYHSLNRGTKRINLNQPEILEFPEDFNQYIDVRKSLVKVPPVSTYYHCNIVKLPRFQNKIHSIGQKPIVQQGNEKVVHHMIVYECSVPKELEEFFENYAETAQQHECYHPNMPVDWRRCSYVAAGWAVGGSGEIVPKDVGIPLGAEHGSADYFLLEVHYDNPSLRSDIVDSSGMRIFYTEQLRLIEGGMIMVGHDVLPVQAIPAGIDSYLTTGLCSSHCTEQLPIEGITIYSLLLHTHLAGRQLRLHQLLRDGRRLTIIADNPSYDFNYQQTWTLPKPVKLLPGDQLLLECVYNTSQRENTTFGGLGTNNEMCLAFLNYYPRVDLIRCTSSADMGIVLRRFGVTTLTVGNSSISLSEDEIAGDLIQSVLDRADKSAEKKTSRTMTEKEKQHKEKTMKQLQQLLSKLSKEEHLPFLMLRNFKVTTDSGSSFHLYDFLKQKKWFKNNGAEYFRPICIDRDTRKERFKRQFIASEMFATDQHNQIC